MDGESRVTVDESKLPIAQALDRVLKQLSSEDLSNPVAYYIDDDGVILISTQRELFRLSQRTRIYDITDLLGGNMPRGPTIFQSADDEPSEGDAIVSGITSILQPPFGWKSANPDCSPTIESHGNKLFIRATREQHAGIERLLDALRRPAGSAPVRLGPYPLRLAVIPVSKTVEATLSRPITVNFESNKLRNVIDFVARREGFKYRLEGDELKQLEASEDDRVSLQATNIPVKSVLKLLLQQVNTGDQFNPLDMALDGDVLVISTRQRLYEQTAELGIYDISDFVVNNSVPFDPHDRLSMLCSAISRHAGQSPEWVSMGGTVSVIKNFRNKLLINHHLGDHVIIQKILAAFRAKPGGPPVWLEGGD